MVILNQKGTSLAEDGEDWNRLGMTILKSWANFSKYINDDLGPFRIMTYICTGEIQSENFEYNIWSLLWLVR